MSWRDTWRQTVESFLREMRGPDGAAPLPPDPVVSAIADARAEVAHLERELVAVESRLATEEESAAVCVRRHDQAERIGDHDTARIARSFARRHAARAALLRRKCAVLEDELSLARAVLNDLLDVARAETDDTTAPRSGPDR